ncbi:MAG TPA: PAS domain S-box protein [Chloroflexota bacterium]|jgi:PAS domain S-box-containing protein
MGRLDDVAAAIVGVDLDGNVVVWNSAAESLFGWPQHEVVGRAPPIVPRQLRQEWRLQMRQVIDGGRSSDAAETQRLDRTGRLIPVLRSSAPLRSPNGEVIGVLDTLTDITAHNQLADESRALTQVRERELIAMDLHDGLIQSLYALALHLAAQERAEGLDVDAAREVLRRSRVEIERVVEEARSYLFDLRARGFAPRDLVSGLRLLVDGLRLNSAIAPTLELDPQVNELLEPEVRGHLLYVAREAVSNILRHAEASAASLEVSVSDERVCLVIVDNGRGFESSARPKRDHRGLHNMASRARLVGGRLDIGHPEAGGTRITLEIPIRRRTSPDVG